MPTPIPDDLHPDDLHRTAIVALNNGEHDTSAALASLATLDLVHHLIDNLAPADTPEWHTIQLPDDTPHSCACGADAFTPYPTRTELGLAWLVCNEATCDAVWELPEHDHPDQTPRLVRGGLTGNEPPWHHHDLVRHRSGAGQHYRAAEYIAVLQTRDYDNPGWWNATVLRVVNPALVGAVIVGQGVRLREGSMYNRVARFP